MVPRWLLVVAAGGFTVVLNGFVIPILLSNYPEFFSSNPYALPVAIFISLIFVLPFAIHYSHPIYLWIHAHYEGTLMSWVIVIAIGAASGAGLAALGYGLFLKHAALLQRQAPRPITNSQAIAVLIPLMSYPDHIEIPGNDNFDDPNRYAYDNLRMMVFQATRANRNDRFSYTSGLLQLYVLLQLRQLGRGSERLDSILKLRKGKMQDRVVTNVVVPPIVPPDVVDYPTDKLLHLVEGNPFLNAGDRKLAEMKPFKVPRGSTIELEHREGAATPNGVAQDIVRIERPGFYTLEFACAPSMGATGLPPGFVISDHKIAHSVESVGVTITMTYRIERNQPEYVIQDYQQWAENLFDGLKGTLPARQR